MQIYGVDHHYKMTHMGKEALLRTGDLPEVLPLSEESMEAYNFMVAPPVPPDEAGEASDNDTDDEAGMQMIQANNVAAV